MLIIGAATLLPRLTMAVSDPVSLEVQIEPRFDDKPVPFDDVSLVMAGAQTVSVTRLDFLISEVQLRTEAGVWVGWTNGFAFISGRAGRTSFRWDDVPRVKCDRLRFYVGVPKAVNHLDPNRFPAGHPLHPDVNGLHWGWMGGYVFLALEGHWRDGQALSGYSWHVATDRELMSVVVPIRLDLTHDSRVALALHLDRIFAGPNRVLLGENTKSTHSRANDEFVSQLRENIEKAFSLIEASPGARSTPQIATAKKVELAPDAVLYRFVLPSYFPQPALPADNPLTDQGVELGRRLFFDSLLSVNESQSCASCHQPRAAFSDGKAVSAGTEGKFGNRNAPALLNLAWKGSYFWDGRAATLREQVLQPIQNPIEMHETLPGVVAKLSATNYPGLFRAAFGSEEITAERVARALEQFLMVQTSYDSKFDRVLRGTETFTEEEQRGFELFHTEYDPRREQFGADCFHCHGGALFQSQGFANNGLDRESKDPGRSIVTGLAGDLGKFAVPSLRNVELTAPYMHDGRFSTLEEVIEHYASGVKRCATLDPNLAKHPVAGLPLSKGDKKALVAFLKTLTEGRLNPMPELSGQPGRSGGDQAALARD